MAFDFGTGAIASAEKAPPRPEHNSLYVSPTGSDSNPGTLAKPFFTLQKATEAARALIGRGATGDLGIYLRGGTYRLQSPLRLGPGSSGQSGYRVIYESYQGERAIISGGRQISGWSLHDGAKNIYRARVGSDWDFRQLYVNGQRATRARGLPNPAGFGRVSQGFATTNMSMAGWKDLANTELVFLGKWMMNRCRIKSIRDGVIYLKNPCWKNSLWSLKWGQNTNPVLWVENAYELLDSPGEWYLDRGSGYLYYKPRSGQDMRNAEVIAPALQDMIVAEGAHDIEFRNLTFAHSTWSGPDSGDDGYVGLQSGYHKIGIRGAVVRMHSPIHFAASKNIAFAGNLFTQLGSKALVFDQASQHIRIVSNRFVETAGGAVQIGQIDDGRITDPKKYNRDIIIAKNYFQDVGFDYADDDAVLGLYVDGMVVEHNEICDIPHNAISIGWGWGKGPSYSRRNKIVGNYIHQFSRLFDDSAAIYTLGPMPETIIQNNYIRDGGQGYGCLYPDEGSAFQTWTGNVCENVSQWLHIWTRSIHDNRIVGNWSDTPAMINKGVRNVIADNKIVVDAEWPAGAQQVMSAAGLEKNLAETGR